MRIHALGIIIILSLPSFAFLEVSVKKISQKIIPSNQLRFGENQG